MNLKEFIEKYDGVPVDFDGIYGVQCMDLMHQFVYDVLGVKDASVLAAPCAKDVYLNFRWSDLFLKIDNTPEGVPQEGDIVFWGTEPYGHVAIFVSGDASKFTSFDANYPTGSLPHLQNHYYKNVLGWLRFKGTPQSDPLDEVVRLTQKVLELEGKLKTERDENATEIAAKDKIIEQQQKQAQELTVQLISVRKEMENTREDIKRLKEQFVTLDREYDLYRLEKEEIIMDMQERYKEKDSLLSEKEKEIQSLEKKLAENISQYSWFELILFKLRG